MSIPNTFLSLSPLYLSPPPFTLPAFAPLEISDRKPPSGKEGNAVKDFSKLELAGSLAVPILTFLWGLTTVIDHPSLISELLGKGGYCIAYLLAMISGGALPIFLTLKYNIHTEDYLKKRIIFIIVVRIIFFFAANSHLMLMPKFFLFIVLCVGAIIYEVFKIQEDYSTNGERAVIMLSDPVIYWTLEIFISFFIDIVELGPSLKNYGWLP